MTVPTEISTYPFKIEKEKKNRKNLRNNLLIYKETQ